MYVYVCVCVCVYVIRYVTSYVCMSSCSCVCVAHTIHWCYCSIHSTTDPPTILSLSPADSTVAVNIDHMIQCVFEGLPIPTVVWSHDGNVLTNGSNDITIATRNSSSTLTITTVTSNDSGSYTCMISNLLGSDMRSSMLQVQSE